MSSARSSYISSSNFASTLAGFAAHCKWPLIWRPSRHRCAEVGACVCCKDVGGRIRSVRASLRQHRNLNTGREAHTCAWAVLHGIFMRYYTCVRSQAILHRKWKLVRYLERLYHRYRMAELCEIGILAERSISYSFQSKLRPSPLVVTCV